LRGGVRRGEGWVGEGDGGSATHTFILMRLFLRPTHFLSTSKVRLANTRHRFCTLMLIFSVRDETSFFIIRPFLFYFSGQIVIKKVYIILRDGLLLSPLSRVVFWSIFLQSFSLFLIILRRTPVVDAGFGNCGVFRIYRGNVSFALAGEEKAGGGEPGGRRDGGGGGAGGKRGGGRGVEEGEGREGENERGMREGWEVDGERGFMWAVETRW